MSEKTLIDRIVLADEQGHLQGKPLESVRIAVSEAVQQQTGIPIFTTLVEARAWEAKNPGKTALTIEPHTPDTAPPTAGTLSVTPSNTSAMLTVAGASDDRIVAGYSFRVGSSAWSPWQASPSYTAAGLSPTTGYSFTHRVKDGTGNIATGTPVQATTTATPPLAPGDVFTSDTFTGSGSLVGQMTSAALGGNPARWEGTPGMVVTGGKAVAGDAAAGTATLAAGLADLKVEFTLAARPTTGSANITLRDTADGRIILNIMPNLMRVQRLSKTAGNTIVGLNVNIGEASVGAKFTFTLKGVNLTLTGTANDRTQFTRTGTDSAHLLAGAVGVQATAGSGFAIDDLVVTAQ